MRRMNIDLFDEDYQILLKIKNKLRMTSMVSALRLIIRDYAVRNGIK